MKSKFKNMDKLLFVLMIIYTILGLIMIFSASSMTAVLQYGYNEYHFVIKQLFYVVLAYVGGFIILFLADKYLILSRKMVKLYGLASLLLLLFTFLFGEEMNGAKSWLSIGSFQIQPVDFVKTFTILYLAYTFKNFKKFEKKFRFIGPFIIPAICFFFLYKQPDFGSALIYFLICFFIFISLPLKDGGFKKTKIVAGVLVILGIFVFITGGEFLKKAFNEEQFSRFIYTNPCTRYTEKTGYQVCNGYIAINNGGLFGVGLGNSTQKYSYLPEAFTDFIFPIIVEELGSIVGSFIIIGYLIILLRIKKIAANAETLSGSLIAYGTFAFIVSHIFINLLGVLAIIPLTGVPLPFLSNGGSFNMNLIILLFMTERVCIESKKVRLRREINSL